MSRFYQHPYEIDLCVRMLSFAANNCPLTQKKTASQIKHQLSFFFTQDQMDRAILILTSKQLQDETHQPAKKEI